MRVDIEEASLLVDIEIIVNVIAKFVPESEGELRRSLQQLDTNGDNKLSVPEAESYFAHHSCREKILPAWHQTARELSEAAGIPSPQLKNLSVLESLVAGGVAGACAKTVIAPGDRVKILFQVSSHKHFTLVEAFKTGAFIVEEEGIVGLWKGNGAMMIRVIPYSATTYMTFDRYHNAVDVWLSQWPKSSKFISGAMAGATAVTLTYPLDLMRARMAAHTGPTPLFESYYSAFHSTVMKQGHGALYHGLSPTLLGIVPYAGTSFTVYGTIKPWLVQLAGVNSENELPKWQLLVSGGFAGIVAQSATYPLDILRRRMQVRPHDYRNMKAAIADIYIREGMRAFYKGLCMNWIKGPIATGVSFTVNDVMKGRIRQYHMAQVKSVGEAKLSGDRPRLSFLESVFAGGVAGAAAKFWTTPVERIKILYQVNPNRPFTLRRARKSARKIRGSSGALALWRGCASSMLRVVPYAAITYTTYDAIHDHTPSLVFTTEKDVATCFVAGAIAGVTATALTYPFDVLRVRMAAHWSPNPPYASTMAGLRCILQREGMSSLTAGLRPALIGAAPFVGINFALYEMAKHHWDLKYHERVMVGAAACVTAQVFTYPLHMVARRLQVHDVLTHGGPLYGGLGKALRHIYNTEGFLHGLYKGMRLTWMVGPLSVGLSFAINDAVREALVTYKSGAYDAHTSLFEKIRPTSMMIAEAHHPTL
eukprot:PhM_4_TR12672/c0_g3_i1/m.37445/K15085/SLC25A42; solute carrier family 25, member 42